MGGATLLLLLSGPPGSGSPPPPAGSPAYRGPSYWSGSYWGAAYFATATGAPAVTGGGSATGPVYRGPAFWAPGFWAQPFFATAGTGSGSGGSGGGGGGSGLPSSVVGTDLATLLLLVSQRLIDQGIYAANLVHLSMEEDAFPSYGDSFALIAPGDQRVDQGQVAGGGRFLTAIEGEFEVRLYGRVALDHAQQDTQLLANATRGLLRKAHQVISCLQLWFPMDSSSNVLVEEPVRLASESRPIKYKQKAAEWGMVRLPFSMNYILNLDVSIDV